LAFAPPRVSPLGPQLRASTKLPLMGFSLTLSDLPPKGDESRPESRIVTYEKTKVTDIAKLALQSVKEPKD
jgi:hypothetical protein